VNTFLLLSSATPQNLHHLWAEPPGAGTRPKELVTRSRFFLQSGYDIDKFYGISEMDGNNRWMALRQATSRERCAKRATCFPAGVAGPARRNSGHRSPGSQDLLQEMIAQFDWTGAFLLLIGSEASQPGPRQQVTATAGNQRRSRISGPGPADQPTPRSGFEITDKTSIF